MGGREVSEGVLMAFAFQEGGGAHRKKEVLGARRGLRPLPTDLTSALGNITPLGKLAQSPDILFYFTTTEKKT